MKTAKRLFPQVASFTNLCRAFRDASQGKGDNREVQEFAYHLEDRLWEIKQELEAEQYVWGRYRPFWISDPKPRLIKAALSRKKLAYVQYGDLDVQVFQQLPLYIRRRVLKEGKGLFVRDMDALYQLAFRTAQAFEDFKPIYYTYLAEVARAGS